MTYQKVSITSGYDLLQSLATFATNLGWTIDLNQQRASDNTYWRLTLNSGGTHISLVGNDTEILMNAHRSFDGTKDWNNQPDQYYQSVNYDKAEGRVWLRVNPLLSVHFFGSMTPEPYIYAAIECSPGYYRHMLFGNLQKFGTSLGGFFFTTGGCDQNAFYSSASITYNVYPFTYNSNTDISRNGGIDCQDASGVKQWGSFNKDTYFPSGVWSSELNNEILAGIAQFNGRSILSPPVIMIGLSSTQYVPFGVPPNVRFVNMNLFSPEDELTIGTDIWKVFPLIRKAAPSGQTNGGPSEEGSTIFGIAYLKA